MSKKSVKVISSARILSSYKDFKTDSTPFQSSVSIKSKRNIENKLPRIDKRVVRSIKVLETDEEIQENFSLVEKQQNTLDRNLLAKSLGSHYAFSSLIAEKEIRDLLIEKFKLCRVSQNEYLLKQKDTASSFFILYDGKLIVEVNGKPQKVISPGECFGQYALLYSTTRCASIRAERTSYLWYIDRKTFRNAIEDNIKKNFEKNRNFIEKNPFFEHLTSKQKDKIAAISMNQRYEKGTKIFKQKMLATSMFIVVSGRLKKLFNGVCTGYYEKGSSLEEYAVLQKGSLRKDTVVAASDCEVIALSVQEIQETLGKSLSMLILRNQLKAELKSHYVAKQLSNDNLNKILDCFKGRDVLKNELVVHPGVKCRQLIFMITQGACENKEESIPVLFGLSCLQKGQRQVHYDMQIQFREQGNILWASLYEIEKALGKTVDKAIQFNKDQKKVNFQRNSKLVELKEETKKYEIEGLEAIKKLGKGQFGTVLLVRDKNTQKKFAIKCISKAQTVKFKIQKYLKREKDILTELSSPFIVEYIRSFKDSSYIYFLMEYINGVQMFDAIRIMGLLSIDQTKFYTAILIHILETMHSSLIVYRDLKPENVMVCQDGYLKIVDLGTCKKFEANSLHKTFTMIGTPNYMAPEILSGKGYTYSVDLWSLGVLVFEFLAGYVPFGQEATDPYEIYQEILTSKLDFPRHMSNAHANLLISQLLSKNPALRLGGSYSKLKSHSFFYGIDWESIIIKKAEAPYRLPKQQFFDEDKMKFISGKQIGSFLPEHGKFIASTKDLDFQWDQTF